MSEKRDLMMRALLALYAEVPEAVANGVQEIVLACVNDVERETAEAIAQMLEARAEKCAASGSFVDSVSAGELRAAAGEVRRGEWRPKKGGT
jgi:hypothetical protein